MPAAARCLPGGDVPADAGTRFHDDAPGEHGDVAVDPSGDRGVAVDHEHVTIDAPGDGEVAAADEDIVVHRAVDDRSAIDGDHRAADRLARPDDGAAGDVDPYAVSGPTATGAGSCRSGGCRQSEERDTREGEYPERSTAHAVPFAG